LIVKFFVSMLVLILWPIKCNLGLFLLVISRIHGHSVLVSELNARVEINNENIIRNFILSPLFVLPIGITSLMPARSELSILNHLG
jgi:hypothetical protein